MTNNQTKQELWKEITTIINCTNLSEVDKELFLELINEYCLKNGK